MDSAIQHLNIQQPMPDGRLTYCKVPHGACWGTNWLYVYPCLPSIIHSQFTHLDWLPLH